MVPKRPIANTQQARTTYHRKITNITYRVILIIMKVIKNVTHFIRFWLLKHSAVY